MKLKDLMSNRNITQTQLAEILGLTQSLISQWVTGKCQPQLAYVSKIAAVLNVTVEEVLNCFK